MGWVDNYSKDRQEQRREVQAGLTGDAPDPMRQADTQAQTTGADATGILDSNASRAQDALDRKSKFGDDDPAFRNLEVAAETGGFPLAETAGETLAGVGGILSGPMRAVQMGILDLDGVDNAAGGESPNFFDYVKVTLGISDLKELEKRTRINVEATGDTLLTHWGWEQTDDPIGRIVRGVAHFGVDLATDPLTYATAGAAGLGRKVVAAGVDMFRSSAVRKIMKARKLIPGGIKNPSREMLADMGLNAYEQRLFYSADDLTDKFTAEWAEDIARGTAAAPEIYSRDFLTETALNVHMIDEIGRPAIARNWAGIAEDARPFLPKYVRGGARLEFPNLPGIPQSVVGAGKQIPGTVGLGYKWNPFRRLSRRLEAAGSTIPQTVKNAFRKIGRRGNVDASLWHALVDEKMPTYQWHFAHMAADNAESGANLARVTGMFAAIAGDLHKLGKEEGIDSPALFRSLHARVEGLSELDGYIHGLEDSAENILKGRGKEFGDAVDSRLDKIAIQLRSYYDDLHRAYSEVDPDFAAKYINGYSPHVPTSPGSRVVRELLEMGGLDKNALQEGDPGEQLLAMILGGAGAPSTSGIDEALGSVRFGAERSTGRFPVRTLVNADGSPMVLNQGALKRIQAQAGNVGQRLKSFFKADGTLDPVAMRLTNMSSAEINELVKPAIEAAYERAGKSLPKGWDGMLLSENPFEVARLYGEVMYEGLAQWNITNTLKQVGLIQAKTPYMDTIQTIDNLQKLVAANINKRGGVLGNVGNLSKFTPLGRRQLRNMGLSEQQATGLGRLVNNVRNGTRTDWKLNYVAHIMSDEDVIERQASQAIGEGFAQKIVPIKASSGNQIGNLVLGDVGGNKNIHIEMFDEATSIEPLLDVVSSVNSALDNEFAKGSLKGLLTDQGIDELMSGGVTEGTANLLYDYLDTKMSSLPSKLHDVVTGGTPWEYNSARGLVEQWKKAYEEFIDAYSAIGTASGKAVDKSKVNFLGGPQVQEHYQELMDLATKIGRVGDIDDIADIMAQARKITRVADAPGFIEPEALKLGGKALNRMQVQENVAHWLRNIARNSAVLNTPGGIRASQIATQSFLTGWKGLVTMSRPTFHIRNAIGIAWMNSIMGVHSKSYADLATGVHAFREGLQELTDEGTMRLGEDAIEHALSKVPEKLRPAFREMWDRGVLAGYTVSEFRTSLEPIMDPKKLNALRFWDADNFFLTRLGSGLMQNIEDYGRGALFLEYFDEAVEGSGNFAHQLVNAVHYDYNNLTPWEEWAKQVIPFFVWTRRNIPRQLAFALENPRMINRYHHMMQAMNYNFGGADENGMPPGDHFSGMAAGTDYYVNPNTPFWARVMIDPDLPVRDLMEVPNPLDWNQMRDFTSGMLGPHITTMFDINNDREFDDVNWPEPINTPLQTVFKGLAWAGFYDNDPDSDPRASYVTRSLYELAAPYSREVIDPLTGGPTDPGRQQRLGIAENDDWLEASIKSVLFTLGRGVGVKLATPADAAQVGGRSRGQIDQTIDELTYAGRIQPRR